MAGRYKRVGAAKAAYSAAKGMYEMKKRKVKTKAQKASKKKGVRKPSSSILGKGLAKRTANQAKSYIRKVNKY